MKLCKNYEDMFENMVSSGTSYLKENPSIKTMIIGLSGGIDSALTAAIAREICNRNPGYKLIGVSIPIETNKKSEINIAKMVGQAFCHQFIEVNFINVLFSLFKLWVEIFHTSKNHSKEQAEKIRYGNIKARLRMIYLYDKAHRNNGIVLSTDNLSEFNLGFWTLHGDVGDFGFIQQLWKTEVYGTNMFLCRHYIGNGKKTSALIAAGKAVPTDGLGVSTSDYDQLGVDSYVEIDEILIDYLNGDKSFEEHPVIQRHLKYAFKRTNPYSIPREEIVKL